MSERILQKIKKLMALGKSANQHEAANALRMAQKMMAEHNLTMTDIELQEMGSETVNDINNSEKPPQWAVSLITLVNSTFGVFSVRIFGFNGVKIQFDGPIDRVQLAGYCYSVLGRLLVKARRDYQAGLNKRLKRATKVNRADLYCEGWIRGAASNLRSWALTPEEKALIKLFRDKEHGELKQLEGRDSKDVKRDQDARWDGVKDGRLVKINQGLDGNHSDRIGHF